MKNVQSTAWSKPIPTKFRKDEKDFLDKAAFDTNLPVSVLVRAAVKMMRLHKKTYRGYGFILDTAA